MRSASDMESSKLERTLRFYNKVRTGCLTCKKRKVKCDEEKPHCRRCTRTGRQCEGYRADRLSPATPDTTSLAPHSGLFASAAERRSFFYFQSEACKPLGGHFNSPFWGREVMRAAIHYPPIRHLVIALGAEYETFEVGTSGQGARFTLQQCNASIRHLTALHTKSADPVSANPPSAETTCCILTASVLFIYLASIRGHFLEAFQHVKSAVKVLQDFERSLQKHDGTTSPSYPVPVSQLRALIISIYGQLRAMVDDVALEAGSPDILVSEQKPATIFVSVHEAHAYVETLFHNTLAFLQETALRPHSTARQLEVAVARHRELCQALESSENALDVLAKGLLNAGDTLAQEGIVILRIYHLLLVVRLRIDIFRPDERESAFDDLEAHLEEMLRYCEVLVQRKQKGEVLTGPPSCSSGLGYVMPLHMVAARCRNPRLRQRAVQLLLSCSRREGIWDAHLAGRIVSQTISMEEQAMGPLVDGGEKVPADRRVREVKLEFQGERAAAVRFVTVDDWNQGRSGTHRLIEW